MIYYPPPGKVELTGNTWTGFKLFYVNDNPEWYSAYWAHSGWHLELPECVARGCPSLADIADVQAMAAPPAHDFDFPYPPGTGWLPASPMGTPDIPIPFPSGHTAEATVAHFLMLNVRLAWSLHRCKAHAVNRKFYQLGNGGKGGLVS